MRSNKKEKKKSHVGLIIIFLSLIMLIFLFSAYVIKQNEETRKLVVEEPVVEEVAEEIPEPEPVKVEEPKEEKPRTFEDVEDKDDPSCYTYVEMEETYFSSAEAQVKAAPYEGAKLVGTMYLDQVVKVTAQCVETGFYRVTVNGGEYYVAKDEISTEYFDIPLPLPSEIVQPTIPKDILFIGNSITLHGPAEFWWGDNWGMGATSIGNDYVHLTVNAMGYGSYDVMSMRDWEMKDARNKSLNILDTYVSKYDYNIIVVFLGENAKGKEAHLAEDLESMFEYIRAFNPDAKIVLVDNFWKFDGVIAEKKEAAKASGVTYCSLAECWGVSKYQLYAGQIVERDGVEYTVDTFVAGHPNNAGMAAISEKLVATLQSL